MYAHNLYHHDDDEIYSFRHNLKGWLIVMGVAVFVVFAILTLVALNVTYIPAYN